MIDRVPATGRFHRDSQQTRAWRLDAKFRAATDYYTLQLGTTV
jgi:hypothetical protein